MNYVIIINLAVKNSKINNMKNLLNKLKKIHIHHYEIVDTETLKNCVTGFGEVPIIIAKLQCIKCGKIKYESLSLPYNIKDFEW